MPVPARIVADINGFLEARIAKTPQDVANMASNYAAMVKEANGRLETCADYLHRGLAIEAVYHASILPDLLEMVKALSFPRAADWNSICADQKVEVAPSLMADVATELAKAQATAQSLKGLLTQMRMMTLAPDPVRDRLAVLRKIVKATPDNPDFAKDLREFEAARFHEIASEAKVAADTKDLETLDSLLDELKTGPWASQVPAQLMENVTKQARQLQLKAGADQLATIYPDLIRAYADKAYEECKALMDHWNGILETYRIGPPPGLQAQIQPIAQWVDEINRQQHKARMIAEARDALVAASDDPHSTLEGLTELYDHARSLEEALPEDLEQLSQSALAARRTARRRKTIMTVTLAAAAVLVVLGLAGWIIYQNIQSGQADGWASRIKVEADTAVKLASRDDIVKAWDMVKKLEKDEPGLYEHSSVQGAVANLKDAQAKVDKDWQKFEKAINDSTNSIDNLPNEEPFKRDIKLAEDLAVSSNDKMMEELRKAKDCFNNRKYGITQKAEKKYNQEVEDFKNSMAKAKLDEKITAVAKELGEAEDAKLSDVQKDLDSIDLRPWKAQLDGLTKGLAERLADNHKFSQADYDGAKSTYKGLENALAKVDTDLKNKELTLGGMKAILDSLDNPHAFAEALKDYAAKNDDARGKAFAKAAAQEPAWLSIHEWAVLTANWTPLLPAKADDVENRREAAEKYLNNNPSSPYRKDVEDLVKYLNASKAAVGKEGLYSTMVPGIMANKLFQCDCVIVMEDGRDVTYYCPAPFKSKPGGMAGSVVINVYTDKAKLLAGDDKTQKTFSQNVIKDGPKQSPQRRLADAVIDKSRAVSPANWDTLAMELLQMIKDDNKVDALCRGKMIELVVGQVSAELSATWGVTDDDLSVKFPNALNKVDWVDPSASAGNDEVRKSVEKALAEIPCLTSKPSLAEVVVARREAMIKALSARFQGMGYLRKDTDGPHVVTNPNFTPKDCKLLVVSSDGKSLQEIGTFAGGQPKLDDEKVRGLPEGTLVFMR